MTSLLLDSFPADYASARQRFRAAAAAQGFALESWAIAHPGPTGEALTIDIALWRPPQATRCVVLSCGLHGVEAPLGSAIQLALLEQQTPITQTLAQNTGLVLMHVLNPYGYAWRRRWNEDGVDLNRNFLLEGQSHSGAPPLYATVDNFVNPRTPPSRLEPFLFGLLGVLANKGFQALKHAVPVGQYAYPQGLFFGGQGPAATQTILRTHLPRWVAGIKEVTHIDFHTGLGPWARYQLLVEGRSAQDAAPRLIKRFGSQSIAPDSFEGSNFQSSGGLGPWCEALLPDCQYDFLTAEFGTYSNLRILQVLRDENRAHCWGRSGGNYEWTKARLVECFAPASKAWRKQCLEQGLMICRQACA